MTRPEAGTHQLVVGGVVVDVEDTSLVSGVLGAPGEVTGVQAERAELVAATVAHDADVGGLRELGVGGLTAELVPEEGEERSRSACWLVAGIRTSLASRRGGRARTPGGNPGPALREIAETPNTFAGRPPVEGAHARFDGTRREHALALLALVASACHRWRGVCGESHARYLRWRRMTGKRGEHGVRWKSHGGPSDDAGIGETRRARRHRSVAGRSVDGRGTHPWYSLNPRRRSCVLGKGRVRCLSARKRRSPETVRVEPNPKKIPTASPIGRTPPMNSP